VWVFMRREVGGREVAVGGRGVVGLRVRVLEMGPLDEEVW